MDNTLDFHQGDAGVDVPPREIERDDECGGVEMSLMAAASQARRRAARRDLSRWATRTAGGVNCQRRSQTGEG